MFRKYCEPFGFDYIIVNESNHVIEVQWDWEPAALFVQVDDDLLIVHALSTIDEPMIFHESLRKLMTEWEVVDL